ncbi:flagellin [Rhizobium sp. Root1220]|uniref:flagellin N-terminal helical domain-containing protein n=1 Tax=Rhizobium sp. Root1220 TaxID=1736432 RepID=UPI000700A065|nr:flagellin [Rhizobium sp. Root1220]KQV68363.1 flagellin [Rhizobium sp. Root1220]
MTYRITSSAQVNALAVLRIINKEAATTQQQVSSGFRVETAADDATYWSYASVMRSDSSSLQNVHDALGVGASKVDTAYTAMNSLVEQLTQIRTTLVTAQEAGVDKTKLNTTLTEFKSQLQTTVQTSSFAGENWLLNQDSSLPASRSVIGGFIRGASGDYQAQTIGFPADQTVMIDMSDANRGLLTKAVDANTLNADGTTTPRNYYLLNTGSTTPAAGNEIKLDANTTPQQLKDMLAVVDSMLSTVTRTAAGLGIMSARISDRIDYTASMSDVIDKGVGALVDTDMDEASIRQKALATQQQMGVQAISILNTTASKVLILLQ